MNGEALALCLVVSWILHADQIDLDITLKGCLIGENTRDGDGSGVVDHAISIGSSIPIPTVGQNTARDCVLVDYNLRW